MARRRANPHIGSSFDAFLAEKGILEDCEYQALKEMLADQVKEAMAKSGLSKTAHGDQPPSTRPVARSTRAFERHVKHDGEGGAGGGARIAV